MSQSSQLSAVRLKTKRAVDHLEEFKANFLGRRGPIFPPNGIGIHLNPDGKSITVNTKSLEPEQQGWLGILLGDVIHQLRASLDHIAYALATRNGKPPLTEKDLKSLEFLIRKNSTDFGADWRVSQGWFDRVIGRDELAAMEAAQPYQRDPFNPEFDPIWVMRELDNIDKHRTFVVIQNQMTAEVEAVLQSGDVHTQVFQVATATKPMKPNAELFSFTHTFPGPIATVEMKRNPVRNIRFGEPSVPGCSSLEVFELTREMIRVTEEIIPTFDRFFP